MPCRLLAAFVMLLAIASSPATAAEFTLYDGKAVATTVTDPADAAPVGKAAELLARDLTALTGHTPTLATRLEGLAGRAVIIGRADAPVIAALLKVNHIDTAPIAGKWETYGRAVIPAPWDATQSALLIFGSDTRGAIYGAVDLSREMGVSPWEWWADVSIRKRDQINVDGALRYSHEPSVKYRAIFLNDEDFGLFPWAAKTYDPKQGDIGPKTYARIFELMWRLKANTIWPAMHNITTPFNQIAGNPEMAAAYAIVHATSHAEPMLRNNVREWDAKTMGEFNYVTNRQSLLDYWDKRAQESKDFENIYTVGLRGIHDSPMVGVDSAKANSLVLADVITEQRKILERRLGKPADAIPQEFTAYKEVLSAYDAGLKLPDDIIMTWPDDNYGYIRRLSNPAEQKRPGGAGVYYHISYWGSPMSYLWLATTHPALLWEEMSKAYRFDARKIWILNVGDLKPGEYLTQLFLDMAFDAPAFDKVGSVRAHLKRWAVETFGPEHSGPIFDVMWRYYDLAFERRPEFMGWGRTYPTTAVRQTAYNMLAYGDENARRLEAYREIAREVKAFAQAMPKDRQDAYYQLVEYPVEAAAALNERVLDIDKSIAFGLQHRASANVYAERAAAAEAQLLAGQHTYNDVIAGGKWRGMMSIAPHRLPLYAPPDIPNWTGKAEGCGVQAEGGAYFDGGGSAPELSDFHREVPQMRYLDIFTKAPTAMKWSAAASAPWIKLSATDGKFSPNAHAFEQRVSVSVDWAAAPETGSGTIVVSCDASLKPLAVGVRIAPPNPIKSASFMEIDRVVSIYATHADAMTGAWEVLDGLGHTGVSLRAKLDMASIDPAKPAVLAKAPVAIYRFATATENDKATLSVIALPSLPITSLNGVRVAVAIDGAAPTVLDLATAEFSEEWKQNVLSNSAVGRVGNLRLAPGAHEMKVIALDPGVTLDRFEIAFTGAQPAYSPIPETRITR
jgi:hypothetical protein